MWWIIFGVMNQNTDFSYILGARLKELRCSKGLSFEKLSKELKEQYGITISADSLMNYEVTDPNHTKSRKNLGMRVEYLRILANYYGVSSDYLLGVSDVKSSNVSVQEMVKTVGLSEHTITALVNLCKSIPEIIEANDTDIDKKLIFHYFLPSSTIDLIEVLIDTVLSCNEIQADYLTISRPFEQFLILTESYNEVFEENCGAYSNFRERVLPRPDYIRFKSHEICKKIEDSISNSANKFRENDYEVMKANMMGEFSLED